MNTALAKWEETGLLQQLSDEKKILCSEGFERLAGLLVDAYKTEYLTLAALSSSSSESTIINTLFPLYRRLINQNITPNTTKLFNHYITWLKEQFIKLNGMIFCDMEYELMMEYINLVTVSPELIA